ncbi:MAG: inorganic phosphate transporter [Bacteroidales bacterium]|jgi:phosphate/sulfate permease|nr:inorganic phosphate transporter [Bacteroidales bacterium]
MIILFYLSSGLFLGWSLGANDAANIFGTAVGTRMIRFKTAAIVASLFVILGAVIQGAGASHTLGKLGSVSTLAAAFTVALSAALTVYWMTRMSLPVSTSQAIVGAIIGWNFYTNNPTDLGTLTKIVSTWVSGPILGGVFAILLFMLVKRFTKKTSIHLLYRDSYIRYGLLIVGAFGAYSLGANNIANVMGVFTSAINLPDINLGFIQIDSTQQLFLIGGIAISIGIITYSKHVMETVGNTLMPLTPEAAIVVVLSQALVLFIFSSQGLSDAFQSIGLPAIPLVPVSSSQVVIGSIIGIGLYKGGKQIKYKILGSISLGWVATPIAAGIIAFFLLFFVNNVFKQDVGGDRMINPIETGAVNITNVEVDTIKTTIPNEIQVVQEDSLHNEVVEKERPEIHKSSNSIIYLWIGISLFFITSLLLLYFLIVKRRKTRQLKYRLKALEENYLLKVEHLEKSIKDKIHLQEDLSKELKFRQSEMVTMAMSIIRKNEFLNDLKEEIIKIKSNTMDQEIRLRLNNLSLMITQDLSIDRDREKFQMHINEQNSNFIHKLSESFPSITDNEKRLASLLRLNLSSKEIASILNISPKSVEMNRYRLRKKLKVDPKINLNDFIRGF